MPRREEAKEGSETLVQRDHFVGRQLTENTADSAFIDGTQVVDESERWLADAARARGQRRVEIALGGRARNGDDGDEREALVADDIGIADYDAGADAPLFVADSQVEVGEKDGATVTPNPNPLSSLRPGPNGRVCRGSC